MLIDPKLFIKVKRRYGESFEKWMYRNDVAWEEYWKERELKSKEIDKSIERLQKMTKRFPNFF